MVEGKGSKNFDTDQAIYLQRAEAAHALLREARRTAVVEYLNEKIRAGCDAVQIFDTWAGILSPTDLDEFSLRYISYICDRFETNGAPVIVFPKGVNDTAKLAELKCDVIGIDWTKDIAASKSTRLAARQCREISTHASCLHRRKRSARKRNAFSSAMAAARDTFLISATASCPTTPPENAKFLVDCVKELSIKYHRESSIRMNSTKAIDFDVLKSFNQQGPRYTSYPTAPLFSPEFTGRGF